MRKFTKTLVAASLFTATNTYALGIGGIKLHSALNQSLNAEIALVTSGESPEEISVKLAPPAKFDQADIPWSYFLSKVRFRVEPKANGQVVIKLTSSEALKEPFLDFLLEVTWPKGNLYREFTVLVDPPPTYKQPAVAVVNRPVVRDEPEPAPAKIREGVTGRQVSPDEYRGEVADIDLPTEYGPVRKTDTVWNIAKRVRTPDVTVAQMAMAIYENNPDAFASQNLNALISGKVLDIPNADVVREISPARAISEFRLHKKQWNELNNPQPQLTQVRKPKPKAIRPPEELKPAEPKKEEAAKVETEPKTDEAKSQQPQDAVEVGTKAPEKQLTLQPPTDEESPGEGAQGSDPVKDKWLSMQKQAVNATATMKTQYENDDRHLLERFEQMEQQLASMQKLLELKDEQLAALQNQRLSPIGPKTQTPDTSTQAPNTLVQEVPKIEPPAKILTGETSVPQEDAKDSVAPPSRPVQAVKPPVNKNIQVQPVAPVTPSVSQFIPDEYWFIGGISAVLLSTLGLIWWRKRNKVEVTPTDMFAASSQITLPDQDDNLTVALADDSSAYNVGMVNESAFLSDFTPSEFDAFDAHQVEIDPISEADVYLAYGRYQQAEELIRHAIQDHPDRDDCKLKLLEIYLAYENNTGFNNYRQELIDQGRNQDNDFWERVEELATELHQGSTIFSEQFQVDAPLETATIGSAGEESKIFNDPHHFNLASYDIDEHLNSSASDDSLSAVSLDKGTFAKSAFQFDKSLLGRKSVRQEPEEDKGASQFDDLYDLDLGGSNFDDGLATMFALQDSTADIENVLPSADDAKIVDTFNLSDFDLDIEPLTSHLDQKTPLNKNQAEPERANETAMSFDNIIEFDLGASKKSKAESSTQLNVEDIENHVDDFDFKAFNLKSKDEALDNAFLVDETSSKTSSVIELNNDFADFSLSENEALNDLDSNFDLELNEELLLKDFDFSVPNSSSSQIDENPKAELDLENVDFEFNFAELEAGTAKDKHSGLFDVEDLSDAQDSLETKLNLANAYIDMGEIETARNIADELSSGTPEQQKAAKEILSKLG